MIYKYKLTTLKNGLRLITVPMPHIESVTVMVVVGAGSRNEIKKVNGLFHFIEHMAFKGTKKRPSTFLISSEVDGVGGEFNAFTDKEITCYYIRLAERHAGLGFDILSDMLANSLFKEKEIEREKGVIIEELNLYEDTPSRKILDVFIRTLYGDNSMGWEIGGDKESIKRIKREDFLDYQEKLYFSQNMVIVVAGKVKEEIKNLTEKYFSNLKTIGKKQTKTILLSQNRPKLKLLSKKTEQAHFCLGVPGYSFSHKDRYALAVLAAILGGGMSSRVFIQIRERRGLAYYVQTQPEFHSDSGYLYTQAGVRLEKIEEAIKIVLEEQEDLILRKVSPKELAKAKEYLKGGMILSLEDSRQVASRYAYQVLLEKEVKTPEEVIKLVDKVTIEDVQRVAKDIFKPEKLNLAIVGPYKNLRFAQNLVSRWRSK